jgi:hypothetical protein
MNRTGFFPFACALILCLCCAAVFLLPEGFCALLEEHDCHGGLCPVCLLIRGLEAALGQCRAFVLHTGFPVKALLTAALVFRLVLFFGLPLNSVLLKVKMNR